MAEITWYVLASKPRQENKAAANLRRLGYTVFLPRHWETWSHKGQVRTVLRPFFPGYLFTAVDPAQGQSVYAINTLVDAEDGVILQRIVRCGGALAVIHHADLWALRSCFDPNGVMPPGPRSLKHLRKIIRKVVAPKMPGLGVSDIVERIEQIDDNGRFKLQNVPTREMGNELQARAWSNR